MLVLHTSLSLQNITLTVVTPSLSRYENLLVAHRSTLSCTCSRIKIPYGHFVTITPTFHQVCTSQFISQAVIDSTFDPIDGFYNPLDVRVTLSAQLQVCISIRRVWHVYL